MVIADPASELVGLVRELGDPAPAEAEEPVRRRAELIRRRFGLALPPPFVAPPGPEEPVRVAAAVDGPAIAAVKWRVFGTSYRGVLPDHFLDAREVVPPASYWTGRAMVPPSRRHRLLVWGRPGSVYGYVDCGPAHADDLAGDHDPDEAGEVWELYVDPSAHGLGGGGRLLRAAEAWLDGVGLHHQQLSVLRTNPRAQAFYRAHGWGPTGRVVPVDLGVVAFEELRYARAVDRDEPHASS
jgi:ribosomal protein S18 acetylase RimI-like enzyme